MNILFKIVVGLLLLGLAENSLGQGIDGSAHDFSAYGWNVPEEICIVCHAPHPTMNTNVTFLWNHAITTQTFVAYSSATMDAAVGQPNGITKLCLSCHDGVTAINSFGGVTITGTQFVIGTANFGVNLADNHPVSFTYDALLASSDGGLNDPTTTASGLGGTISEDLLINNKLQCSSCHDVHNGTDETALLVMSNDNSDLCLVCHDK